MPERIAVQRLIIGDGKARRMVMPGEIVDLDSETAAILDRRDPPAVRDPRAPRPETNVEAAAQVNRVAEPAGDTVEVASENITRGEADTGGKDNDPL